MGNPPEERSSEDGSSQESIVLCKSGLNPEYDSEREESIPSISPFKTALNVTSVTTPSVSSVSSLCKSG